MKKNKKKEKNKKKKIIFLSTLIVLVIAILIMWFSFGKDIYDENMRENAKDKEWVSDHVKISLDREIDNVYTVKKSKYITIDNDHYKEVVDEKIDELLKENFDISSPLVILNPYGDKKLDAYIYFNTDEETKVSYNISVNNWRIDDISGNLKNNGKNGYTKEHSYVIELVPGERNVITLTAKKKNNSNRIVKFDINMNSIKDEDYIEEKSNTVSSSQKA